jgi:hypothetical protein
MSDEFWKVSEIEVTVSGFFTTHHHFQTESGEWGEMTFPAFAQRAVFRTADDRELEMGKTHWLGSAHELVEGDTVRAAADRPGLLHREMVIRFDGREYELVPEGLFKQGWFLVDQEGNTLLEIQPRGVFREGAFVTITGWVDADLVVFAYYLVHMRKQEDAAAAAAASGAAVS